MPTVWHFNKEKPVWTFSYNSLTRVHIHLPSPKKHGSSIHSKLSEQKLLNHLKQRKNIIELLCLSSKNC